MLVQRIMLIPFVYHILFFTVVTAARVTEKFGFGLDRLRSQDTKTSPKPLTPAEQPLQFPQWLEAFTGLKSWPGNEPPYIPLDFIDFSQVPQIPAHNQGQCQGLVNACSFDCFNCISYDDVYTCPRLSQTFDDGPTPQTIKLVLDGGLKDKLTFFTLGVNVVRYPHIYREVVRHGHVMGSHTWSHKYLPSLLNEQIVAQLEWSIWAMNATAGHLPKWFRPPYGGVDDRVRAIVRQFGMQLVLWNMDTFDWKLFDNLRTEQEILGDIDKYTLSNQGLGLVLEHDTTLATVNLAINIQKKLPKQMTVPQCVGGIDYIKLFKE
ncbi:chitin deacetylase [Scheffersomyces spartinae]|uniref:chitin deacetylase n=1 Tax=Scheffersomyces spartinae TaxID=45513 RepID=A0A9P8AGC0_9ASCO|nr:chitin deacetylase [Scheffersomyces spartinae]KAG7191544.1 chitin deacetylase [Scheffersomyces spartinae]